MVGNRYALFFVVGEQNVLLLPAVHVLLLPFAHLQIIGNNEQNERVASTQKKGGKPRYFRRSFANSSKLSGNHGFGNIWVTDTK